MGRKIIITILFIGLCGSAMAGPCDPGQIWAVYPKDPNANVEMVMRVRSVSYDLAVIEWWIFKERMWALSKELFRCADIRLVGTRITEDEFDELRNDYDRRNPRQKAF
jgi:hypothetical protein